MTLRYTETGIEVKVGDTPRTFWGRVQVVAIEAPRHSGSTGRVYIRGAGTIAVRGFDPGVICAHWEDDGKGAQ